MRRHSFILALLLSSFTGCSEETGKPDGNKDASAGDEGTEISFQVPSSGKVFLKLAKPAVVAIEGDGQSSKDWDLAFSGYDVFTNSGLSGPGAGSAFGPLDPLTFLADTMPEVPFLTKDDHTGGAFVGWYDYGEGHVLWSRYRLYGIRDADRLWKVQILSYYGDLQGTPVSALYQVRYAEVKATGNDPPKTFTNIDATATGGAAPEDAPTECVDLGTGERVKLKPADVRASSAWHLCFRRETISVNGELGGPRGVTAVDLDENSNEKIEDVMLKNADTELPRFEALSADALNDAKLTYRGDHVVSAFSGHWLVVGANPPAPREVVWFVNGGEEGSKYLLEFIRFEGAAADTPGTVVMRVKTIH
jgi:hypothetical protein